MNYLYYLISTLPVALGTVMAFGDGIQNFPIATLSFLIALGLQVLFINRNFFRGNPEDTKRSVLRQFFISVFHASVLPLCYYWQSGEMNIAVIISGFPCGLFALSAYSLNRLIQCPDKDSRENIEANQIHTTILIYSLTIALLIPVLLYLLMRDHIYITLCSFLIVYLLRPISKMLKNTLYDIKRFNQSMTGLVLIYLLTFSIGWVFS